MASNCIRHPRHVIQQLVIGRQPDLVDGPTVTHERPPRPVPHTYSQDFSTTSESFAPTPSEDVDHDRLFQTRPHMKTQTWVISIIGFTTVALTAIGTLVSILRH